MASIHKYFRLLKEKNGSDLHLATSRPPLYRNAGEIVPLGDNLPLTDGVLKGLLREVLSEQQWVQFEADHDLDFATSLEGVGRFRGNIFLQEYGIGAVFRMIPDQIIPIESLGIPPIVGTIADMDEGLILVTGPTGSGKSTTLASIIDLMNRNSSRHIVTIEDPIEFVHQNKRSVLSHREVGTDTLSFAAALRGALRQDADVILVGEMRDTETISLAIEGASMGALVLGTLHTSGAAKTIDRIIDTFPKDQQSQARTTLSDSLAAVVSQILCRRIGGGRVAVHEILFRTSGLGGAIREGNTAMINSIIATGRKHGMQTLDDTLFRLVQENTIHGQEAYLKANDKKRFQQWAIANGVPSD